MSSTLALMSFSELLGTVWFSALCAVGGGVGGQVFPMSWIVSKIKR